MKYPKEAVKQCMNYGGVRTLRGDHGDWISQVLEYAAWAHEQLRPRKVSEEKPPITPGSYLVWLPKNSKWFQHSGGMCDGNYWLPLPQPPPEDDGFEEWWKGPDGCSAAPEDGWTKTEAKQLSARVWKAALANRKDKE